MSKYTIEIPGRPVPKSYGKSEGRMYRDSEVAAREKKVGELWNYQVGKYWANTKLAFSLQACYKDERHADIKNIIYLAEDALSEVAYADDKQIITYQPAPKILIQEEEKTVIWISEVDEQRYGFKEV